MNFILNDRTAMMICEGRMEAQSQEHLVAAWQHIIDNGHAFNKKKEFISRSAIALIDAGVCHDPLGQGRH